MVREHAINPMLDARYVRLWSHEPHLLPASVRQLVAALIRERNTCSDARVEAIDRELVAVLRPFVERDQDQRDQVDQVEPTDEAAQFAARVLSDGEKVLAALGQLEERLTSSKGSGGKLLLLVEVQGDSPGLSSPGPLCPGEDPADVSPVDPREPLHDLGRFVEQEAAGIEGVERVTWKVVQVLEEGGGT